MPTRRDAAFGLAAIAGSAATATRAAPLLVPFQLRIAIPSPGVSYLGDVFAGGDKAIVEGTIDMGKTGPAALSVTNRFLGATKRYAASAASPVTGKPSWYVALSPSAPPTETGQAPVTPQSLSATWTTPAGATHGVRLVVAAANPLVTGSPDINAEVTLGLRAGGTGVEFTFTAQHDGFPDYRLKLGANQVVYSYDCVAAGDSPIALFPPMERSGSAGWAAVL